MDKMRAVVCNKYGPPEVLQLTQVEKPTPEPNEVLIRIRATTAHVGDAKIRSFKPGLGPVKDFFFKPIMRLMLGFRGPRCKILGMDLAGDIVAIGKDVKRFKIGDPVFGSAYVGFRFGAYAEYICLAGDGLVAPKPPNMSYEEIAPIANGALTALLILRKVNIQRGQKVLIYGASGSLGTFAVQLARHFGAEVTGVCSTRNLEMVKSLGAGTVIDYTQENFNDRHEIFDVIFDAVAKMDTSERKKSLKKTGTFLHATDSSNGLKFTTADMMLIGELCKTGEMKAIIDRRFPLEKIVEAHRYVDRGRKIGNVVITV